MTSSTIAPSSLAAARPSASSNARRPRPPALLRQAAAQRVRELRVVFDDQNLRGAMLASALGQVQRTSHRLHPASRVAAKRRETNFGMRVLLALILAALVAAPVPEHPAARRAPRRHRSSGLRSRSSDRPAPAPRRPLSSPSTCKGSGPMFARATTGVLTPMPCNDVVMPAASRTGAGPASEGIVPRPGAGWIVYAATRVRGVFVTSACAGSRRPA